PRDLPKLLRSVGQATAKMRRMAGEFQAQFNEALREAELDDVRKSVKELKALDPRKQIRDSLRPLETAMRDTERDIKVGLDGSAKAGAGPEAAKTPAASAPQPEPDSRAVEPDEGKADPVAEAKPEAAPAKPSEAHS